MAFSPFNFCPLRFDYGSGIEKGHWSGIGYDFEFETSHVQYSVTVSVSKIGICWVGFGYEVRNKCSASIWFWFRMKFIGFAHDCFRVSFHEKFPPGKRKEEWLSFTVWVFLWKGLKRKKTQSLSCVQCLCLLYINHICPWDSKRLSIQFCH